MDKQREAFEAWYEAFSLPAESDWFRREKDDAEEYFYANTHFAWQAWQSAQQAQWLPIETAPRDETPILAYAKSVFGVVDISEMFFVDGDWYWFRDGEMPDAQPTHWMPLPPEPQP